jgi:flagellar protein FlaG
MVSPYFKLLRSTEVVMAIEALVMSPQPARQIIDIKPVASQSVAPAETLLKMRPEPVVEAPKVEINHEPIISSLELEGKITQLNEAMVSRNQAVSFSTDSATGTDVVRVTNKNTGEVIRQIPSEEVLASMKNLEEMVGLIFNQRI